MHCLLMITGVAVGAGWQWLVAYVNVGCYYIVGLPLGFLLGTKLNMGVMVSSVLLLFILRYVNHHIL